MNFCHTSFLPRPQVKNPRACQLKSCQLERQKANEKAWREQNWGLYDSKYHSIRKVQRHRTINHMTTQVVSCIKAGKTLLGHHLDLEVIKEYLAELFLSLGIRKLKKFCQL